MNLYNSIIQNKYGYLFFIGIFSVLIVIIFYFVTIFDFSKQFKQEEIVITYADNISPSHLHLINKFNQENKGRIRVEPVDLPFSKFSTNERKELLARSLRSKSKKLDLFAIDLIWSARFAKWSESLNKFITSDDTTKLLPQSLQSCIYNGNLVALPMYIDIGMMYYRKDLLKKLPDHKDIEQKLLNGITWQDFIELRSKFNLPKNQFYIFPADNYEGLICSYVEILYNHEQNVLSNSNFQINTQANRKTFKLLFDIVHSYHLSPYEITEFNENNCYKYFIENEGIFLRGWPSSEKDYKNLIQKDNVDSMLGRAPVPHLLGSEQISVLGGWNIMVSKYSEHKREAFQFIKFILEEQSQKDMYEIGAYLPVIKSLYEDQKFLKKYHQLEYDKFLLSKGVHRPFLENYTKISDVISFYVNKVIKNEISIDEALEIADEAIKTGRIIIR